MSTFFPFRLVVSFVIGGCFIAMLSVIAGRSEKNLAGIVMMIPSTMLLGYLFLGLENSEQYVRSIIPGTFIPLGIVVLSIVVYNYSALFFCNYSSSKLVQLLLTFFVSNAIWLILVAPFAIGKFSNLPWGIAGFFILVASTHQGLNSKGLQVRAEMHRYTAMQILARAIFGGTLIAFVIFMGKIADPFWAGVFAMYPATTFATLLILHYHYEPSHLFYFMKNAPRGSLSLFIYNGSMLLFLPGSGIIYATMLSLFIAVLFSFALLMYKR